MTSLITSIHNPIIQHVKSLHQKNKRDKLNQLFIEGYRIVKDAFERNAVFEFVVTKDTTNNNDVEELLSIAENRGIKIHNTTEKVFNELSDTKTPQGILAVIHKPQYDLHTLFQTDNAFFILLENLQDPGNMGTIIRTADAAGVTGVIVSKGSVDIYNPKVLRATMGSIFHLPIVGVDEIEVMIARLKNNNFNVYAAHLEGNSNCFEVDMTHKTAIVIGNEANGISDKVAKQCQLIKIPMLGKAESLNASVSAAIITYEYVRQKTNQKGTIL